MAPNLSIIPPSTACSKCIECQGNRCYLSWEYQIAKCWRHNEKVVCRAARCCKSVAIRKKRHGNIGLNGHLRPLKMQKSKQKHTKWTYWKQWKMRLKNHTVDATVLRYFGLVVQLVRTRRSHRRGRRFEARQDHKKQAILLENKAKCPTSRHVAETVWTGEKVNTRSET